VTMDAERERLVELLVSELDRAPIEALEAEGRVDWRWLAGHMTATKDTAKAELETVEPASEREAELRAALDMKPRAVGPGEEFTGLIDTLGLTEWEGCSCSAIRSDMNRATVAGCRRDRDKFIERIKANVAAGVAAKKISRWAWAKAACRAVRMGLAFKIDPRDPIPGLFDVAVDNAEKAAKQKASRGEIE
jgi:hypothetical protein